MKYSIRYNLRTNPAGKGMAFIRLRLSWLGHRIDQQTGIQIEPEWWDAQMQRVRPSYRHGKLTGAAINRQLSALDTHIEQLFIRWQSESHAPTQPEVREAVRSFFRPPEKNGHDIFKCLDEFINTTQRQNGWTYATIQKHRTMRNHLHDFAPKLTFADLDEKGLSQYMYYLQRLGHRNTTIQKQLSFLRWFLRWAVRHGHTDNDAFETFRPRLKGTDGNSKEIIYLEWDELMRLYDCDFESRPALAVVRDVFCFCCFSGLRYSDVASLRMADIKDGQIVIVTKKTRDGLRIELNDFTRAILGRYRLFQVADRRGRAFPVISNQKMNAYLKEACQMAGIDQMVRLVYYKGSDRIEELHPKWEIISSHAARRTFVINALRLGIPAEVIMKWTGHSNFTAMRPYVKIVDDLKRQEMNKFNLLSSNGAQA